MSDKAPHRSWLTQRIANRYPKWAEARANRRSIAQQMLNPIATEVESLFKDAIDGNRNHTIMGANLDQLDVAYIIKLPESFEFITDGDNPSVEAYVPPIVIAKLNGQEIEVAMTDGNTIDEFYYTCLPTRVVDASRSASITSVLPVTSLAEIYEAELGDMPVDSNGEIVPNRLVITVAGCTLFLDTSRRVPASFIMIEGITNRDIEETERLIITRNGVFVTRKVWKSISKLSYYGLEPDTATIRIDPFYFNKDQEVDKYQLSVNISNEKLYYHRLTSHMWGSVHQQLNVIANTLGDLYRGENTLEVVLEEELGYDDNGDFANAFLQDIAIQPFTGRIFGIDSEYLYVYEATEELADMRGLREKTSGADMIIETDSIDYLRGDTMTFSAYWRRPVKRFQKNRWTITKPDGTQKYLSIDGDELNLTEDAWIYNQTYTELVFGPFESENGDIDKQAFELTLTQRGTYQIKLEVYYVDGTLETDILPVHVHYKEALARIALPASLHNYTGLAFDADQKLWLYKAGTAKQVVLAVDNMLVSFEEKTIYLHENYDSVTVYASLEWGG